MSKIQAFTLAALLPVIALTVSGCYTPPESVDTLPKFHDGASASVVLRFYSWDNVFLVKPECREEGFLRVLKRDDITPTLSTLGVQRDMAVVVMGCTYKAHEQKQIVDAWKAILKEQGFQRIVCLRASDDTRKLNGMSVIGDSTRPATPARNTAKL